MWNSRSSVVHWLWTNNPFYFISALLMLYAVRTSYGVLEIGAINSWVMMGVLALYTSVLSVLGVVIVRWGRVWDDARSIFLLLLLMFLAVSISADDLFVRMESSGGAIALLACGLAFSIAVFQFVLRGAGIRLGLAFQLPLILFMALFYITPWWFSPELHPRRSQSLDGMVFLFPQVAAVLSLTLLPAVRRGCNYVRNNGTPWAWPMFPWIAFAFIGFAVIVRSYALTLTFSQTGPIWVSPESRTGIVLDTIWRPYFIVSFLASILLLVMEAGLASGNARLVRRVLLAVGALIPLAWPWSQTLASSEFVLRVTDSVGSPVWLATLLAIAFYGWATIRRIGEAPVGLLGSVLLLTIIGPRTVDASTLVAQPVYPLLVGAIVAVMGFRSRSTALLMSAAAMLSAGLWLVLPVSVLPGFRAIICYHFLLLASLGCGVYLRDRMALALRNVIAVWLPLSCLLVLVHPAASEVAVSWRMLYVAGLAIGCVACAWLSRSRAFWLSFAGTSAVLAFAVAANGFRSAGELVGRNAMTAFSWSLGMLFVGALISAFKAGWLNSPSPLTWIGPVRRVHDAAGENVNKPDE